MHPTLLFLASGDPPTRRGSAILVDIPEATKEDSGVFLDEHFLWVETHNPSGRLIARDPKLHIRNKVLGIRKHRRRHHLVQKRQGAFEVALAAAQSAVIDKGIFGEDIFSQSVDLLAVDQLGVTIEKVLNFQTVGDFLMAKHRCSYDFISLKSKPSQMAAHRDPALKKLFCVQ